MSDTAKLPAEAGVGIKVRRVEDARFVTGEGLFVDDIQFANMAFACVLRSPHPHARIRSIEIDAARRAPGVIAVLTGRDVEQDKLGRIQCPSFPTLSPGTPFHRPEQPVLAIDKVRHVGDRVAFVVAETLVQAKDAAELIAVDYEPLAPVPTVDRALAPDAPRIWDESDSNLCFPMEKGDAGTVDAAFKRAAHVTSIRIRYPRASANPMEPRAAIGRYEAQQHKYTLYTGSPQPHRSRALLANTILHVPESDIRIVTPDVGGAFGMRGTVYPEEALVLWSARKLGRPVKWTGDRSECLMSDMHGRDQLSEAEIALDPDGRILALRTTSLVNVGAYLVYSAAVPPHNAATTTSGAYDIPLVHAKVSAVFTTTNPLGPYRGSGRPETTFLIERLIDKAARETGVSSIELRRLNMIPTSAMPYKTPGGSVMDCGDLARALEEALDLADWRGLDRRKAESKQRGRLRGLGVGLHAENAAQLSERVDLRIDPSGSATVHVGTVASGQSHETMYSQLVSGWLGIPLDQIRVYQGDTDKVTFGRGTLAARTAVVGGSALRYASDKVIERGKCIAALMLEASETDIEFENSTFKVSGTDRSVSLKAVARKAYATDLPMEFGIGLEGQGTFSGPQTYPYGCMVCEVEVDPATGVASLNKFLFVDDVGIAINPMVVEGQTHGSIAQASGQVLMEDVVFDPDSGQLLTGSFQDYCMPRADNFPFFTGTRIVIPTKTNPLGAKGGSETGSFGAPPAVVNAILDALSPLGVTDIGLPATSERVWRAIVSGTVDWLSRDSGPNAPPPPVFWP